MRKTEKSLRIAIVVVGELLALGTGCGTVRLQTNGIFIICTYYREDTGDVDQYFTSIIR